MTKLCGRMSFWAKKMRYGKLKLRLRGKLRLFVTQSNRSKTKTPSVQPQTVPCPKAEGVRKSRLLSYSPHINPCTGLKDRRFGSLP